ncbi:MAG: DUF2778 domain-containing protein [Sandaracinaceae bacterium]|nr:DUF2778 domain-containing protein [Sandaracinaceae bacterium]
MLILVFRISQGRVWVFPDGDPRYPPDPPWSLHAESGISTYMNDPAWAGRHDAGPIPPGNYYFLSRELNDPTVIGDVIRRFGPPGGGPLGVGGGDWGDWRIRLHPEPGTDTHGRENMFLHGGGSWGKPPGTIGCVDVGGGIFGDLRTDHLRRNIIEARGGRGAFYAAA